MNWLKRFMNGRYGLDQLSVFLLCISVLISILGYFKFHYILYLAYLLLIIVILRMFSKNIYARKRENNRYIHLLDPIKNKIRKRQKQRNDKTHRYYKCTKCKTTLRVPKGKGKITITCPKCQNKIIKKT